MIARFALEGMSRDGLRPLAQVLASFDGAGSGQDSDEEKPYDEQAGYEAMKLRVAAHNAWWRSKHPDGEAAT
jgi:hypothetical protein